MVVKRLFVAGAALAALAGCSHTAKPIDIHGTLTLRSGSQVVDAMECTGSDGYDDIAKGAQVTITDAAGKTIAVGKLGRGQRVAGAQYFGDCQFPFSIKAPGGESFYGVEVSHRGVTRYSAADAGHAITLTLG